MTLQDVNEVQDLNELKCFFCLDLFYFRKQNTLNLVSPIKCYKILIADSNKTHNKNCENDKNKSNLFYILKEKNS